LRKTQRSRAAIAAAALLVAALAWPSSAAAHGLVQRANLPIPEWLFGWAAAIVLVVSFAALAVLWPKPRLERPDWRPLPGGMGRWLGSSPVEVACGAIGVALLVIVVAAGYTGNSSALDNLAPTFILITFWVGMVFVSALFGDVFHTFNPWRALGRATEARRSPTAPTRSGWAAGRPPRASWASPGSSWRRAGARSRARS
jgi:hypothetical protein